MSPSKRKFIDADAFDQDDSFKHRRSSLRVNLSVSNLSDSGNGSLKPSQLECINNVLDTVKKGKVLSKSTSKPDRSKIRTTKIFNSETVNDSPKVYNGVYLKRVSIVLENISSNEQLLNASCRELKDAILNKTREIFDAKNELSIKTAMILEDQTQKTVSDNLSRSTNECAIENPSVNRNADMVSRNENMINKQPCLENSVILNPSISNTPKNRSRSKNMSQSTNKSRLRKKRLFLQNTNSESANTKDHELSLKSNFSKLSLAREETHGSPILTSSNKRLNVSKLALRTPHKSLKDKSQKTLSVHCNNKSISQTSTTSEDESIFGAIPVGCSTMVEDNISSEETEEPPKSRSNKPEDLVSKSPNRNIVTMELTSVQGDCFTNYQYCSQENKTRNEKLQKSISKRRLSTQTRRVSDLEHISPSQKSSNPINCKQSTKNVTSKNMRSKSILEDTHNAVEAQFPLQLTHDSMRTVQSSMNVNTSIDVLDEDGRKSTISKHKKSKGKRHSPYSKNGDENHLRTRSAESEQETINTVCTSLQMNTSLDGVNKLHTRVNSLENEKWVNQSPGRKSNESHRSIVQKSNDNLEENISLIERLRNLSIPAPTSNNFDSHKNTSLNREPNSIQTDSGLRHENDSSKKKDKSEDYQSYIEATPYPTSRSVLLKSQLKQTTVIQNFNTDKNTFSSTTNTSHNHRNHSNDKEPDEANTTPCYLELIVNNRKTSLHSNNDKEKNQGTIILDDSPIPELHSMKSSSIVIIDESGDAVDVENSNNVDIPLSGSETQPKKKPKKKLLPLRESSQLMSLTPVEERPSSPKQPVFTKRRKKAGKKINIKKSNVGSDGNNANQAAQKNTDQLSLKDDHVFRDTKKQKKQKKILSKKIVINKIVNGDILEVLGETRKNVGEAQEEYSSSNRNSMTDFQAKRMSVQSQMKKLRRMILVTTGLSKEDKSLVKTVVKTLGTARIEPNVTRRTTHVVSTGIRTINLLHGIIRGCWLVSLEWVLESLENNKWLDPQQYEMTHFSKAVLENRRDRQLFGDSYIPELFATCGFIYVKNCTKPPCNVLKDLIKAAGGRITDDPQVAKIVIGTEGLKETWVLDCITTGELQSCNQYQRS